MDSTSDVVVVGAGIGGAVLALALGQRGWKVTLLEREAFPPRVVRPEILWGPTPQALDALGVGEAIRSRASLRIRGVEVRQGGQKRLRISNRVFERAEVEAFSSDPGLTRAIIAEAALATGGATLFRGAAVAECIQDGTRIVGVRGTRGGASFETRARLIVGDDGANSVVRASLGPPIDVKLFPLDFITATLKWPSDLPADEARVWIDPLARGDALAAAGFIPWPRGEGIMLMPLPHALVEPLFQSAAEIFWKKLEKLTPLASSLAGQLQFPGDFKHVRRPYGHAPTYITDGAAILGDAAHPMSPAGGQGANASIWDALELADVAHEALSAGDVSRQQLSRYESLRRPANARSLRFTQFVAKGLRVIPYVPAWPRLVPLLLGFVDSLPILQGRFLATVSRTFVTGG